MSKGLSYFGSVDSVGKLRLDHKSFLLSDLKMFSDCKVVLSLRLQEKSLSNPQRRFYMGVIIPKVAEALISLGHERWECTPKLVHELLWSRLGQFDPIEIEEIGDLSTSLFSQYIGSIQRFCAMYMGVILPDPQ